MLDDDSGLFVSFCCGEFRFAYFTLLKAFDTISHASVWEALHEQGVPYVYITLLSALCSGQLGEL